MSDMPPITRPMRRNKIGQDARETIFSRGAATLVSPLFDHAHPRSRFSRVNVIGTFRTVQDGVDAAVPVDAKNAPTSDLENCKERSFPQRPHRSFPLQEEKEQRRALRVCQSDCLNRGVHPSQLCPFLCPLSREFGATRYEESASANREFGSVPVNRTHSVRVSRGSCWSDC